MSAGVLSLAWAWAPILHFQWVNSRTVPPSQVLRPCVVLALAHAGLYLLLRRRCSDNVAGAILSIVWALFFAFPHLQAWSPFPASADGFSLLVVFFVGTLVVANPWTYSGKAEPVRRVILYAGAGFFVTALVLMAIRSFSAPAPVFRPLRETAGVSGPAAQGPRPDIYYLILDSYARQDVLRERFGYDNEPFLRELEARGFQILRDSRSNYSHTSLSLASSLNMEYMRDIGVRPGLRYTGSQLKIFLAKNRVARFLKGLGYRFVTYETGAEATDLRDSDEYRRLTLPLNEFELGLLSRSPLLALDHFCGLRFFNSFALHQRRVLALFRSLDDSVKEPGPRFVFVHLISPHPPFVFDREGKFQEHNPGIFMESGNDLIKPGFMDAEEHRARYIEQLLYVNRRLLETLDRILAPGVPPALVILQSDHGSDSRMDHDHPWKTDCWERFGILMAVRWPDPPGLPLPGDLTPVNLFRAVFSRLYGSDLPLYPNEFYLSDRYFNHRRVFPPVRGGPSGWSTTDPGDPTVRPGRDGTP